MKITKRQLRRIIKEVSVTDDWTSGDYAQAIRDFSKELTGRRDTYGSPEQLTGMDDKQLSDYYANMFDSPEATAQQDEIEAAHQASTQLRSDAETGYEYEDSEQERSPKMQGMGRRHESVLRITQKQLRATLREGLHTFEIEILRNT